MNEVTTQEWFDTGAWVGRQQAFAVIASKCSAAQAVAIKELRESRAHEKLGLTWDEFCPKYLGVMRGCADRYIRQLEEFGASYFNLSQIARISPDTYRQIADKVQGNSIDIEGENIPLTLGNAARIRAGVKRLRAQLAQANREARQAATPDISILVSRIDEIVERTASLAARTARAESGPIREVVAYAIEKWATLRAQMS